MNDRAIGSIFGMQKQTLSYQPHAALILPTTNLGLEFEFEGVNLSQKIIDETSTYWTTKPEHSLHDNGMEFVFHGPLFGKDVVDAVQNLSEAAIKYKWKTTMRAAVHVHMDARDLSYPQLVGLCMNYAIYEPALYAWVKDGRDANNFCLPWYKCEGSLSDAANLLINISNCVSGRRARSVREMVSMAEEFHKYAGMTLRPLHQYGSVEFRHLEATKDFGRIIQWLNIILALKREALDAPESSMVVVNDILHHGVRKSLIKTFGEAVAAKMIENNPNVIGEIKQIGIPNAIELLSELDKATIFSDDDWKIEAKRDPHPGIEKWRANSFPKGLPLDEEKPPGNLLPEDVIRRAREAMRRAERYHVGQVGQLAGREAQIMLMDDPVAPNVQLGDLLHDNKEEQQHDELPDLDEGPEEL